MGTQRIRYITDAMASQGRAILHLTCGHNISVTVEQTPDDPEPLTGLTKWDCPRCETPIATKSPAQLWKEAGEP